MATTRRFGSLNILTGRDGQVPQFLIDGSNTIASLSNAVAVNSIDDLPDAVNSVISTPPDMTYVWAPGVQMGSTRIAAGANNSFLAFNGFQAPADYTGTNPFITVISGSLQIKDMTFTCPNSTFIDISGGGVLLIDNIGVIDCELFFNASGSPFVISSAQIFNCTNGITVSGSNIIVGNLIQVAFIASTGTLIDLSTATFLEYEQANCILNTTGTAMSGLAGSGNIVANVEAIVGGCNFVNATTPLNNISPSDIRWSFSKNSGVADSTFTGNSFLTTTETVTISDIGVFVAIAGTNWSSTIAERFTTTAAGILTYIAETDINVQILLTSTIEKVGGGTDQLCARIAINGTTQSETESCTENASPTSVTSQGLFNLSNGDTIQGFVANVDATANIIVDLSNLSIINGF